MMSRLYAALAAAILLACGPALAADNYTIQSGGQQRQVRAKEISGVLHPLSIPFDQNGVPLFTSSNPGYVNLTGPIAVTGTFWQATQPVSAVSLPLPTGATTAAAQATGNASLGSIDGKTPALITGRVPVDPSGVTSPVSAAALPLPTGAATASAQATGNTALASIATALGSPLQAGGSVGGYTSVAIASFTRPANTTAYASGQLVANSTTAGSVAAMQFSAARVTGGSGLIRRGRLTKSGTGLTGASFDMMLYRPSTGGACPTSAAGDGATYSTDSALTFIGRIPVTMDQAFTDGAKGIGTPAVGSEIAFDAPAGFSTICGFVRATGAYTPLSAEVWTAALEILPN